MDTRESPGQEPTANPREASAGSEPIPKREPTLPTTTPTSSTSRPRRLWSRLESARNRLKALEPTNSQSSSSQPQPQDDGPSSQGGSLPEDRDASTLNDIIDNEATGNGTADTLPTNEPPTEKQPASETAAHDSPTSGHNEDESKPDARNPPPESSEQGRGTDSPPPMSVDKAAEDATKLLGLNFGILLWTLVYRVINLEHLQGFNPDEYDKIQNISVDVGQKLQDTQWHMRRKQQATPAEHSGTITTQMPTETKPESIVTAMALTPTVRTSEMIKTAPARIRGHIAQAIKEMKALQAESPETVEAKSAWLQRSDEFGKSRLCPLQDQAEAILLAETVSPRERIATAKSLQEMNAVIDALVDKRSTARTAIAQATAAELSKMPQTIPAKTPTETKSEMAKATTAQLPEDIDQAIETMKAFQAESPETLEAKSAWLRRLDEFSQRMDAVDPPREAMPRLGPLATQLVDKREMIETEIAEAKIAELPKMLQTVSAQTPTETQVAPTQAAQRAEKLETLRCTVAQLPEIAEETELPLALKKTAAEAVTALKRSRTSLPTHLQRNGATPAHMWEAARVFRDFKLAEAIITARLKLTGVTGEEPAADKHAGPTYPWGIFKELEEAAKTTMDYEVSMARPGFDKREVNLRDATGAQLRSKRIKFLLRSITAQCASLGLDLVLQGKRSV
ncbi:hypothetical protein B0J15DRAFT_590680 [Fusarium solani]|uniref:Uncharacterized protein n=1 Tax=Fusarium solani TaxID=169388 RepID=A0A9P9RBX9_FUSSL|nr:uncharacterized protein B0J15DRAFT_590680 [Fusarium solani]KAH7272888.1 hypothetical protein B0J15DRAFT_590680 [Fusarium solani]